MVIVACIVDVSTGKIIETTENNKDKLLMRLKCRDHYNAGKVWQSEKNYYCVEFSHRSSYSFAKDAMKRKGLPRDKAIHLDTLYKKWWIERLETIEIPEAEKELVAVISSDPGDYQYAKDEAIEEAEHRLSQLQQALSRHKKEIEN